MPLSASDRALGDVLVGAPRSSRCRSSTRRWRSPSDGTCGSATPSCRATGSSRRSTIRHRLSLRTAVRRSDPAAAGSAPAARQPTPTSMRATSPYLGAARRPHRHRHRRARPGDRVVRAPASGATVSNSSWPRNSTSIWAVQTAFADAAVASRGVRSRRARPANVGAHGDDAWRRR